MDMAGGMGVDAPQVRRCKYLTHPCMHDTEIATISEQLPRAVLLYDLHHACTTKEKEICSQASLAGQGLVVRIDHLISTIQPLHSATPPPDIFSSQLQGGKRGDEDKQLAK